MSVDSPKTDEPQTLPTLSRLHEAYANGTLTPGGYVRKLLELTTAAARDEVWISRRDQARLLDDAALLDAMLTAHGAGVLEAFPLFGSLFAVKDNIDVEGIPTTAACPAFAYTPERSAQAVQRILDAKAVFVGKTNLDQFATGLVGARSPYGIVRNSVNPDYISGGSSSGSAVAVAMGLVDFALGTDTAGSGRVPAGLNGIVGIKPSRGLVSTAGMLPACRTLDCVSIFSRNVADAWRVLRAVAGPDGRDDYSRALPMIAPLVRGVRIGIAAAPQFFGDSAAALAYALAIENVRRVADCVIDAVDVDPLTAAADLLYRGPWIAERRAALGEFFTDHRDQIDETVCAAIAPAVGYTATDAFVAEYKMASYRQVARSLFETIDVLLVPTAPNHPTIAEVRADPVGPNTQLGYYTNFVNLLDLAAIAIPAPPRADGLPFGLTLIGPCGSDHRLAVIGARLSEHFGGERRGNSLRLAADPLEFREATIDVAVVGAHLSGEPLNWQLLQSGARLVAGTASAPRYRLYALPDTTPAKPGIARVAAGGRSIELEVWRMPQRAFGAFIAQVSAPLGIGSVELADGRWVKGFVCEPIALAGAEDISEHGGWRAYLAAKK
jgi:allophanate hydrolase